MKLLIISSMSHYVKDGRVVGWGPTVQEIDHLAQLFDEIRHIACLHAISPPLSALPYSTDRIRLIPLRPTGGQTLKDKLGILKLTPLYLRTILRELPHADVVHVRCPANIPLLAILLLTLVRKPRTRWVKYAGNWQPTGKEARSYTLQRWWLNKGLHRGVVTVNGKWPNQPEHVKTFYNPCLTSVELAQASEYATDKQLTHPMRLLFVGRLDHAKGVARSLEILALLVKQGVDAKLDLVGDGPGRQEFEQLAVELNIRDRVEFHGWLPRTALGPLYSVAHIMLFPSSSSEGWPKVLSEAMAYGVVPVASDVSSIPQYLQNFETGHALQPDNIQSFVDAIAHYSTHPEVWRAESQNAVRSAHLFSYKNYLQAVSKLLGIGTPEDLSANSVAALPLDITLGNKKTA